MQLCTGEWHNVYRQNVKKRVCHCLNYLFPRIFDKFPLIYPDDALTNSKCNASIKKKHGLPVLRNQLWQIKNCTFLHFCKLNPIGEHVLSNTPLAI